MCAMVCSIWPNASSAWPAARAAHHARRAEPAAFLATLPFVARRVIARRARGMFEIGSVRVELVGDMVKFRRNIRSALGKAAQLDRSEAQKPNRIIYRA